MSDPSEPSSIGFRSIGKYVRSIGTLSSKLWNSLDSFPINRRAVRSIGQSLPINRTVCPINRRNVQQTWKSLWTLFRSLGVCPIHRKGIYDPSDIHPIHRRLFQKKCINSLEGFPIHRTICPINRTGSSDQSELSPINRRTRFSAKFKSSYLMSDQSDPIEGDRFLTVECLLFIWNSVRSCWDDLDHHLGFVGSFLL